MEDRREYMRNYMNDRRKQQRIKAIDYLGGSCLGCGVTDNLEFDHINPKTKSVGIANLLAAKWETLKVELDKCQLLCCACHLKKTIANGETSAMKGRSPANRIDNYTHGTEHMYRKQSCRCDQCRRWRSLYRKKLVDTMGNPR